MAAPIFRCGPGDRPVGAFYRGRRLVSIDGSTLDLADTAENAAAFGRQAPARGGAAFPQLRIVAIVECTTHAMFAAAMGPYSTGESTLARDLVARIGSSMLVLADRGLTGHPLFSAFAATGADLLWRAKTGVTFPVLERHYDGSFRSELVATDDKRKRADVLAVRIIEYTLDDPGRDVEDQPYRLVTTILDPNNEAHGWCCDPRLPTRASRGLGAVCAPT